MTKETTKYSITRLLVKKRNLEALLDKGISLTSLLYTSTEKTFNKAYEDSAILAQQAAINKFNDLIEQHAKISDAITLSNATTKVNVDGVSMTVAAAIARKNNIKNQKVLFSELVNTKSHIEKYEQMNEREISREISQRIAAVSGREAELSNELVATITNSVKSQFKSKVSFTPNLAKLIETNKAYIDGFLEEIDVSLNESNATTQVELSL